MQLSKITALLLGSIIALSPIHTLAAQKQKVAKSSATKTVIVQKKAVTTKSAKPVETAKKTGKKAEKQKVESSKTESKKGKTNAVATTKVANKKANKQADLQKKSPKAPLATNGKAGKNKVSTAKPVQKSTKKSVNVAHKKSATKTDKKALATKKTATKKATAKNDTKKLYGVKGAKLTHVKVSDRKYSYREKGKTYTSMKKEPSRTFSQTGVASYYGGMFHGRRTANGEVFNKNAYTAAHKTLALGSYALVTNLRNGRKVIVRINDRGPFSHSRILDLSVAAAREIGMIHSGTARVRVEAMQVDRHGYISGKGAEALYKLAKRTGLNLKVKGEGDNLAIKAE